MLSALLTGWVRHLAACLFYQNFESIENKEIQFLRIWNYSDKEKWNIFETIWIKEEKYDWFATWENIMRKPGQWKCLCTSDVHMRNISIT